MKACIGDSPVLDSASRFSRTSVQGNGALHTSIGDQLSGTSMCERALPPPTLRGSGNMATQAPPTRSATSGPHSGIISAIARLPMMSSTC